MGMAHRGRLNILANIFGKATQDIFSEFDAKDYDKEYFDGDVKYHLGLTSERKTKSGKKINTNSKSEIYKTFDNINKTFSNIKYNSQS
jgi:2-oxoglutarate dehydrogenase E1 component